MSLLPGPLVDRLLIKRVKNAVSYVLKPKFRTDTTITAVNKHLKCFNLNISTHSSLLVACISLHVFIDN